MEYLDNGEETVNTYIGEVNANTVESVKTGDEEETNMILGVDDTVTNVLVSNPSKCYEKDVQTKITEYQEDQGERIVQIKKSVETASKNKAILSLKYDSISFKISCIQISVIVFSALITFIETLNALYELHDFVGTVLPILFATYIASCVSDIVFCYLDVTKEWSCKV